MNQDLFNWYPYPEEAGTKTEEGPSREAAQDLNKKNKPQRLRSKVIATLELFGSMTADECADKMRESILSIRPRFSELSRLGKIYKTGELRPSSTGKNQNVWRVA